MDCLEHAELCSSSYVDCMYLLIVQNKWKSKKSEPREATVCETAAYLIFPSDRGDAVAGPELVKQNESTLGPDGSSPNALIRRNTFWDMSRLVSMRQWQQYEITSIICIQM